MNYCMEMYLNSKCCGMLTGVFTSVLLHTIYKHQVVSLTEMCPRFTLGQM